VERKKKKELKKFILAVFSIFKTSEIVVLFFFLPLSSSGFSFIHLERTEFAVVKTAKINFFNSFFFFLSTLCFLYFLVIFSWIGFRFLFVQILCLALILLTCFIFVILFSIYF